jgi:hypothetical protein
LSLFLLEGVSEGFVIGEDDEMSGFQHVTEVFHGFVVVTDFGQALRHQNSGALCANGVHEALHHISSCPLGTHWDVFILCSCDVHHEQR